LEIADRRLRICQHSFSTISRGSLCPDRLLRCLELVGSVFAVWLVVSMDDGNRHLPFPGEPPPLRL
jgi:hypothetical protein